MTISLNSASAKATINWDFHQTNSFGTDTSNTASMSASTTYVNGSGNGKANQVYAATLTVTGSAGTQTITLDATSKDPLGNVLAFVKIKQIYVSHKTPAATGTLTVGGNFFAGVVLTGTTPLLVLEPGMALLVGGPPTSNDLGWAVTTSTHDAITFTNNDAASVTVDVCIIGE